MAIKLWKQIKCQKEKQSQFKYLSNNIHGLLHLFPVSIYKVFFLLKLWYICIYSRFCKYEKSFSE